ncbi:MAG TPA: HlyD family efflux transporter periplasmic adaptor subunit [Stellaceae bacterium]|nr:HlyD family efflux transporter periplasmic adaptor subunit [Stellaceae bacterium]
MSEDKIGGAPPTELIEPSGGALVPSQLPATILPPVPPPRRGRWLKRALALLILLAAGFGGAYLWRQSQDQLPPGIFSGNGRIEADEIDIETKYAGRIAKLMADEGDLVTAGQVVALMDTRDLEASLKKAQAQVQQSQKTLDEAKANVEQQKSQLLFAQQELERARSLVPKGYMPKETLDQRQQQVDAAVAALNAANFRVGEAEQALEAATHDVELYSVEIADNSLVAPRDGRIQYRVANVGEVLPAGGKVFTMLDVGYVYMDIYLPTLEAGRVKIGSDARILLDAYPTHPIPSKVVFVASQAQFTPKTVETKEERDKLMFRIRVRIDPERLRGKGELVRSGLPGIAYVRTDPAVAWPPQLQGDASE